MIKIMKILQTHLMMICPFFLGALCICAMEAFTSAGGINNSCGLSVVVVVVVVDVSVVLLSSVLASFATFAWTVLEMGIDVTSVGAPSFSSFSSAPFSFGFCEISVALGDVELLISGENRVAFVELAHCTLTPTKSITIAAYIVCNLAMVYQLLIIMFGP